MLRYFVAATAACVTPVGAWSAYSYYWRQNELRTLPNTFKLIGNLNTPHFINSAIENEIDAGDLFLFSKKVLPQQVISKLDIK